MPPRVPLTVAHGGGVGPEIMDVALTILKETGAGIEPEVIEIGKKVYLRGNTASIDSSAAQVVRLVNSNRKAGFILTQGQ